MMSEKFCLKWNDFHSNVSKSFGLFRNEEYLHDVTLVSDDHSKVSAHKLVLSACSDYFRDIFMNNQHSNPLICLDGISSEDLKNITDYIYNGQVNLHQNSLERFLIVAQRLKLQGLIQSNTTDTDEHAYIENSEHVNEVQSENLVHNKYNVQEAVRTQKLESNDNLKVCQKKVEDSVSNIIVAMDGEDMKEIDDKINGYLEKCSDGSYKCTLCGRTSAVHMRKSVQKQIIQRHIETHIDGLTYTCPVCQKLFRSKHSLISHKSKFHK